MQVVSLLYSRAIKAVTDLQKKANASNTIESVATEDRFGSSIDPRAVALSRILNTPKRNRTKAQKAVLQTLVTGAETLKQLQEDPDIKVYIKLTSNNTTNDTTASENVVFQEDQKSGLQELLLISIDACSKIPIITGLSSKEVHDIVVASFDKANKANVHVTDLKSEISYQLGTFFAQIEKLIGVESLTSSQARVEKILRKVTNGN